MKRTIFMVTLLVITLVFGVLTLPGALSTTNKDLGGEGSSSASGDTTWVKRKKSCYDDKDPNREKITCTSGGTEQCTAKYCN